MVDFHRIYDSAKKLEKEGKFMEASVMYEEILEVEPTLAEVRVNQAICFSKAEQFDKAVEALDTAIQAKPELFTAHYCKGIVLKQMSKFDAALTSFHEALLLSPEIFVYEAIAEVSNRAEQYEKALDFAAKGLSRAEKFTYFLHVQRIVAFLALERHEDAFDDVQAILRERGWSGLHSVETDTYATVYKHRANSLLDDGHAEEALALLAEMNKALKQSDASGLCMQAFCLILLDKVEKAFTLLQAARDADPAIWRANVIEAKARMQMEDFEQAAKLMEEVIGIEECSRNTGIRFLYAESLFHLERFPEALDNYKFVLKQETNNWVAHERIGYLLIQFERWDEAVEALRNAIESSDGEATDCTHYNLGYALLMRKEMDISNAHQSFQTALRLNPDNEGAKTALEQLRQLRGESEEMEGKTSSSRPRSSAKVTAARASTGKRIARTKERPYPHESTNNSKQTTERRKRLTRLQTELVPSAPSSQLEVIPVGNTAKLLGRFN